MTDGSRWLTNSSKDLAPVTPGGEGGPPPWSWLTVPEKDFQFLFFAVFCVFAVFWVFLWCFCCSPCHSVVFSLFSVAFAVCCVGFGFRV